QDLNIQLCSHHYFISTIPPPPKSTLFPYTTLFRSKTYPYAAATFDQRNQGIHVATRRDQNSKCEGSEIARSGADRTVQDRVYPIGAVQRADCRRTIESAR